MSHWNHRVCKETVDRGITQVSGEPLVEYTIREVFYNDAGEIVGVTMNDPPIGVYATDEHFPPEVPKPSEEDILKEMRETVERFEKALSKPIIDMDTIKYGNWDARFESDEEDPDLEKEHDDED